MQIGSCWLVLDKRGSNVKKIVTPAELKLLANEFTAVVGKHPIHNLEIFEVSEGKVTELQSYDERQKQILARRFAKTDSLSERRRLQQKYGKPRGKTGPDDPHKIDQMYPGENPQLPEDFEDLGKEFFTNCTMNKLEDSVPYPGEDYFSKFKFEVNEDGDVDEDEIHAALQRV